MLVAVGNGPSFGGGLRITEGAVLDDGLLDVVIIKPMSQARPDPDLPQAVQGHPRHPPAVRAPPRPLGDRRGAGHRVVRRRRALRPAAPDRRVRPGRPDSPGMSAADAPGLRRVRRAVRLRARRLPGARLPRRRGGPRRARRRPDRLGQDGRRGVRRPPGPRRPAASASTRRRSRRCRTRSTTTWSARYGADRVGLLTGDVDRQRRGAGRGDDHRGAPQHAVRRLRHAARPRATS